MERNRNRRRRQRPRQYLCVNGDMHVVTHGQFVTVQDYERLLRKYKKIVKLVEVKGVDPSYRPRRYRRLTNEPRLIKEGETPRPKHFALVT